MQTVGDKIVQMNAGLSFDAALPEGFAVLNPFRENPETMEVMAAFYARYYGDFRRRQFIIGINPSRHGAGVTGVPFTDTKRLATDCGIRMHSAHTHELSSVFIYEMIRQYGGAAAFYADFYINSPFPLAIVRRVKGKWLNANYYDDRALFEAVKDFMIESLRRHIAIGVDAGRVFVLGKKNADFLSRINREANLFGTLVVLEHPRYIQQYRSRDRQLFIDKYLLAFADKDVII